MDKQIKDELANKGYIITVGDFEINLQCDEKPDFIYARITKKKYDKRDCPTTVHLPIPFSEDEVDMLVQDFKDLSDWRHYRRLANKLKE